ncbi:PaaI family thioesterase [Mesorhizobium sp. CAU 1732]|uniref:PaaI family thioesterase n=1 Tax=Mesorhizobium sp. CAU 1732 TaxID=3140358 RepID=UPI003260F753
MSDDTPSSYRDVGLFALLGLEMTHSEDGRVSGQIEIDAKHKNRAGFVHGGVLCSMIDFAACAAGLHAPAGQPPRFGVTLSLTTHFTKAVDKGVLRVDGRMVSAARKSYTAQAHIYDDAGDLVAHGIGTFQWRPDSAPASQPLVDSKN